MLQPPIGGGSGGTARTAAPPETAQLRLRGLPAALGDTDLGVGGVADGTRTHDDQNHNLGLYQLSYSHRRSARL